MCLPAIAASARWAPAVYLLIFILLLFLFWTGYVASDDAIYANGAYGWLTEFPYVGGHGTIRYPLVMPMALSLLLLGENIFALVLPSLLYSLTMAGLLILLVCKADEQGRGIWAALLLVTSPLLVIHTTIASIDITEAFYLFASFLVFYKALRDERKFLFLFLSGALAGVAFLSRETAIFIAVFYGVLFLCGYGMPRKYYWCVALGFFAVWTLELLYLAVMTGDPFYRINISLHHWTPDRPPEDFGNFKLHPLLDPFLLLLVNQEFMFLFWFGLPAGIYVFSASDWRGESNRLARLLVVLGAVWLTCAIVLPIFIRILPPVPRYYMVPVISFSLAIGLVLAHMAATARGRNYAWIIGGFLIVTNLAGMYVENRNPIFGEKDLASIANDYPEPVYTDPMTLYRADLLLDWKDAKAKVRAEAPPPGSLYFYNPPRADTENIYVSAGKITQFQPQPGWREIRRSAPDPKFAGLLLEKLGLADIVPARLWKALYRGHPGTVLYRVSE